MTGQPTATQSFSFEIPRANINGPLNLTETVLSGQTSEPEWLRDGAWFTNVTVLDNKPVKYTVNQVDNVDDFSLKVRGVMDVSTGGVTENLEKHLTQGLGLRDDLDFFYRKFAAEDKVLSLTFKNLRGLRLMRGADLFESLICSILSQNNSVKLWNRSARLMMQHYGRVVAFPDGSQEFLFPRAEALAKLKPRELSAKTSMGYRAKPVVNVSRMIAGEEVNLIALTKKPYADAVSLLLELPGVGPKVADCFLLYGAGYHESAPVDVWIHRIVSKLYFHGKKVSRLKTGRFLRERFREWAGYAQLYLFDYARTGEISAA